MLNSFEPLTIVVSASPILYEALTVFEIFTEFSMVFITIRVYFMAITMLLILMPVTAVGLRSLAIRLLCESKLSFTVLLTIFEVAFILITMLISVSTESMINSI